MAKMLRRVFLGSLGSMVVLAGAGSVWLLRHRASAEVNALLIDPEKAEFVYRDGWIVSS